MVPTRDNGFDQLLFVARASMRNQNLQSSPQVFNRIEIEAIVACWHHVITTQELGNLVKSMPNRIKAVIAANFSFTFYFHEHEW